MSGRFWLSEQQGERLRLHVPTSRGKPRVDDRRVLSGILFVLRNGLRWQDAPAIYGPHKTVYSHFVRWSRLGVFARVFRDLAKPGAEGETLMRDSPHLKAHRTAARLRQGDSARGRSGAPRAAWTRRCPGSATDAGGR